MKSLFKKLSRIPRRINRYGFIKTVAMFHMPIWLLRFLHINPYRLEYEGFDWKAHFQKEVLKLWMSQVKAQFYRTVKLAGYYIFWFVKIPFEWYTNFNWAAYLIDGKPVKYGFHFCLGKNPIWVLRIQWALPRRYRQDDEDNYWQVAFYLINANAIINRLGYDTMGNAWSLFLISPHFSFKYWFNKWFAVINPLRGLRRAKLLLDIEDAQRTCSNIINDPMCGCPGDFADDYSRKIDSMWMKYQTM